MHDLTQTRSGVYYESPSAEIEAIVLIGRGWTSVIKYHGYHPMLPKGSSHWSVLDFNNIDAVHSR